LTRSRLLPTSYNLPIFWSSEDLALLEEAHTDILPHSRNMRTSILRLYFGFLLPLFHVRAAHFLCDPRVSWGCERGSSSYSL